MRSSMDAPCTPEGVPRIALSRWLAVAAFPFGQVARERRASSGGPPALRAILCGMSQRVLSPQDLLAAAASLAAADKLSAGTLDAAEHAELLRITDEIELLQAERVRALVELARLRGKKLGALMKDLGIEGPSDAAAEERNLVFPEALDRRLHSLLDKQDQRERLTEDEQAEAEALVDMSQLLTLLRLRVAHREHP